MSNNCHGRVKSRVFYNSLVNKKVVCGLLAKANKAKFLSMCKPMNKTCRINSVKNLGSVTVTDRSFENTRPMPALERHSHIDKGDKNVNRSLHVGDNKCQQVLSSMQGDKRTGVSSSVDILLTRNGTNSEVDNNSTSPKVDVAHEHVKDIHVVPNIVKQKLTNTVGKCQEMSIARCDGTQEGLDSDCVMLFDIKDHSSDKYSFLSLCGIKHFKNANVHNCQNFASWKSQTDFDFGFIPLGAFALPDGDVVGPRFASPVDQHRCVKASALPIFLGGTDTC